MISRPIAAPSVFAGKVGWLVRPLLAALLLCALPLCTTAFQQPGLAPAEPESSTHKSLDPISLATLGWGMSLDRTGGPLDLASMLIVGEKRNAWIVQSSRTISTDDLGRGMTTLFSGPIMPAGPLASFAFLIGGGNAITGASSIPIRSVPFQWRPLTASMISLRLLPRRWKEASTWTPSSTPAKPRSPLSAVSPRQTGTWPRSRRIRLRSAAKCSTSRASSETSSGFQVPKMLQRNLVSEVFFGEIEAAGKVVSVHFVELPPGVDLNKGTEFQASFAGYLFKLVARNKRNSVPVLIGRTFQPLPPNSGRRPLAAAALMLSLQTGSGVGTAPLTELALLQATQHLKYWQLFPEPEMAELRPDLLLQIRDKGFFPGIQDDDGEGAELDAYYDFLKVASVTPVESFAKDALTDVTYAQLIRQPAAFRGKVLRLEGTLKSLRKHEAHDDGSARRHSGPVRGLDLRWRQRHPPLLRRADGIAGRIGAGREDDEARLVRRLLFQERRL